MITRRKTLALLGAAVLPGKALSFTQSQVLTDRVSVGTIPDVASRLPQNPRVVNVAAMGREPGRHGGTIRSLIGGQRDVRLMPINGYSRLVGYSPDFTLQADILDHFEVVEDRSFTFHIRKGHRWSDGTPLTAEDFRYCWEDVNKDPEISPSGVQPELRVAGKEAQFEVLDEFTVRYTWDKPIPDFLPNLAGPVPLRIVLPSAYLKGFHAKYQSPETMAKLIADWKVDDWVALHQKVSRQNRPENPGLPTLEPWMPTTMPPAEQFVFDRNPYFHRVDENGAQLPYIDRWVLNVSSTEIITAKTATGESDLQYLALDFNDFTLLKQGEAVHPVHVSLWTRIQGSRVALIPNLNCNDPGWRAVLRDVRVRRAMSLAVNRQEINEALFYGLGTPSANTVLPGSPLYKPEYAEAYAGFDLDQAARLLDEAGLNMRNSAGLRLLPDGKPANLIIETAGESTLETDLLELIRDQFRAIGIAVFVRALQRDLFRSRALGGDLVMSVWQGLDNGVPTAEMPPSQLAPTLDDQLQWPLWGLHFLSSGTKGEAPDMPEVQELVDLMTKWRESRTTEERQSIWARMLQINAEQVFTIGTVNATPQPLLRANWLRNMPENALYGYDPSSYLGVYMPDTFWKADA
ncbi:MAG: ABC transporter substrate-binding protein [Gemmobacter sp.]|nr:ABC transporter substrate-binding protein [Gemmobacter sp.]